jgi:hypothetical protein
MEKREASNLYEKIFLNTDTEMNFMSYFEYGKMIELGLKNFNIYIYIYFFCNIFINN